MVGRHYKKSDFQLCVLDPKSIKTIKHTVWFYLPTPAKPGPVWSNQSRHTHQNHFYQLNSQTVSLRLHRNLLLNVDLKLNSSLGLVFIPVSTSLQRIITQRHRTSPGCPFERSALRYSAPALKLTKSLLSERLTFYISDVLPLFKLLLCSKSEL